MCRSDVAGTVEKRADHRSTRADSQIDVVHRIVADIGGANRIGRHEHIRAAANSRQLR